MTSKISEFAYPDSLDMEDRLGYGIGALVMHWGTCESLLYGMLDAMIGHAKADTGAIVWLTIRNARDRMDLLQRIAKERDVFPDEIALVCRRFGSINKVRNFFCHGYYSAKTDGTVEGVHGYDLNDPKTPVNREFRPLDKALLNQIACAVRDAQKLNPDLWRLLVRVRDKLGTSHPELPLGLEEYLKRRGDHLQ
jgi:hypothetical protein